MHFAKMHGLGNDFVVVNAFKEQLPEDLPALAFAVCHRRLGIGADGLLILAKSDLPEAAAQFLIFNSDGSQAENCGNGIRCAALFAKREGIVSEDKFTFELMKGLATPQIIDDSQGIVRVDMGEPILEPRDIPAIFAGANVVNHPFNVAGEMYNITLVSMGNPHCVIFVDDVEAFPVREIGPLIETDPVFPEKTNVEFIERSGKDVLKMRVWERGCGETMACGTGACAALTAAVLNGYVENKAEVVLAYGSLDIEWDAANQHIYMTGPATLVAEGDYNF